MRLLRLLLASVTLMAASAGVFAAEPKNGIDYITLDTPRVDAGKKIEVVEFFLYSCPHCNALEPLMAQWVKQQGDKVAFRRVHMMFGGPKDPQAHAYAALEAMGKLDVVQDKIFHAVHVERVRLNKDEALADFVAKNGVDKAKYLEMLGSFGLQTKIKRNAQLVATYKIDSVPSIVIDGATVCTVAERGSVSRMHISPKNSPRPSRASSTSAG